MAEQARMASETPYHSTKEVPSPHFKNTFPSANEWLDRCVRQVNVCQEYCQHWHLLAQAAKYFNRRPCNFSQFVDNQTQQCGFQDFC